MTRIGIDFGTTHTGAAMVEGNDITFIPLDLYNREPQLLRSMIYITRDHTSYTGIRAVETYLEQDTGRLVRFEDKFVGTVENTVARIGRGPLDPDGPIQIVYDVVVAEDVGAFGRLIQSIKTALRDPSYDGTNIFGRYYSVQNLIAQLLTVTRQRAELHVNRPVTTVVIGRPVTFAGDPAADIQAEQRLREAAAEAGFAQVSFELEPIAAARFYTRTVTQPETVLVFDFGGGTLDLTIMRTRPGDAPEIVTTFGVLVGGDDIDSALMRNKIGKYFGVGTSINGNGAPFPYELANLMEHWQTIPLLSRPQNLSVISGARENSADPAAFERLETLVLKNYGFALFQAIEQAKRDLSVQDEAEIRLTLDGWDLRLPLNREEFPRLITREMAKVQRGLNQIMELSTINPEAIDVVVTTGGSSLIPIFQTMLQRKFTNARLVRSDTFGSVTAGLALRAAQLPN